MALHAFEIDATLPAGKYNSIASMLSTDPTNTRYHQYYSITPAFQTPNRGLRIPEIALTYVSEDSFAGVLCVDDGPTEQKYMSLLKVGGISEEEAEQVPVCSFRNHIIAGRRIGENYFRTMNILHSNFPKKGNERAETIFSKLVFPGRYDEMKIQPKQVFDLGYLVLFG